MDDETKNQLIRDESERRNSVRLEFTSDVIVRTEDGSKTIKGELVNLAIGGLAFSTPSTLKIGEICYVAIVINDRYSQLVIKDVRSEVVRCGKGEIAFKFHHRFEWLALFHVYQAKSGN